MKFKSENFRNPVAALNKKAKKPALAPQGSSEMESLENRVLLSGIGTGLNKKKVTFFDADGDKVIVSLQGHGSFNIDLGGATDNSDIANITINGAQGVGGSL